MADDPYKYFRLEARDLLDQLGAALLEMREGRRRGACPAYAARWRTRSRARRESSSSRRSPTAHMPIEDVLSPFRDDADGRGMTTLARAVLASPRRDRSDAVRTRLDRAPPRSRREAGRRAAARDRRRDASAPEMRRDRCAARRRTEMHALVDGLRASSGRSRRPRLADRCATEQLAPRWRADPRRADAARGGRRAGRRSPRDVDGVGARPHRDGRAGRTANCITRANRAQRMQLSAGERVFPRSSGAARDAAQSLGEGNRVRGARAATSGSMPMCSGRASGAPPARAQRGGARHRGRGRSAARRQAARGADHARGEAARQPRRLSSARTTGAASTSRLCGARRAARRGAQGDGRGARARDSCDLLLRGGISTSEAVNEIAGRGVGLDVVREAAGARRRASTLTTEPRRRAQRSTLPCRCRSRRSRRSSLRPRVRAPPCRWTRCGHDAARRPRCLERGGRATVIYDVICRAFLVAAARSRRAKPSPARRARARDRFGRRLDRDGGRSPGRHQARRRAPAAGARRRLADCRRCLARCRRQSPARADPQGLAAARGSALGATASRIERHPVLVIDDSLTTRMLEQSILESAGYGVDLAVSAEEALEIARRRRYALFLVDVEMPGMTGSSLSSAPAPTRCSRRARDPRDVAIRRRTGGAGATPGRGYIVKGEFDQRELLAMIEPLVAGDDRTRALVVEDSLTMRRRIVRRAGRRPRDRGRRRGRRRQARPSSYAVALRPDVVTLDMMLPVMAGPPRPNTSWRIARRRSWSSRPLSTAASCSRPTTHWPRARWTCSRSRGATSPRASGSRSFWFR